MTPISRRRLLGGLAGSALAVVLPARASPAREPLARRLGLAAAEERWLEDLSAREQAELLAALSDGRAPSARAVALASKLLSRRSHLFPYLGYPQVADKRTVCDGLVRE